MASTGNTGRQTSLPDALELTLTSPDGESGYPGTITVTVSYRLENGTLTLTYDADTDQDTLCSLTNHSYFNLAGSGSVDSQVLQVSASAYARQDADNVPDGTRASVEGTPMDLRQPVALGTLWEQDFDQIRRYRGIDHHYWADGSGMRAMAKASCPENGITHTVSSDLPGLQVYTGNALNAARGKGGIRLSGTPGLLPGDPAGSQPCRMARGRTAHSAKRTALSHGHPFRVYRRSIKA